MTLRTRLLFGPLAAAILLFGVAGLAMMVPGYDQVRQTVSEIGEAGSPANLPFTIMLCCVAAALLVFASAVREVSREAGHSPLAAYLIGCSAISAAGVGIFFYPHPLHNVFGLFELVGYQAPLAFALTWRRDPDARTLVRLSWIMAALVWLAILLNLATLDRHGALWAFERPFYGIVQRALFASWFGWCVPAGLLMMRLGQTSAISTAASA